MLDKAKLTLQNKGEGSDVSLLMSSTKRVSKFGTREEMRAKLSNMSLTKVNKSTSFSEVDEVIDTSVLCSKPDSLKGCTKNNKTGETVSALKSPRKQVGSITERRSVKESQFTVGSNSGSFTETKKKKRKKRRRRTRQVEQEEIRHISDTPLNRLLAVHNNAPKPRVAQKSFEDRVGRRLTTEVSDEETGLKDRLTPIRPFDSPASIYAFMHQNSAVDVRKMRDPLPSAATFVPPDTGRDSSADAFRELSVFKQDDTRKIVYTKHGKLKVVPVKKEKEKQGSKDPCKTMINQVKKIVKKNL